MPYLRLADLVHLRHIDMDLVIPTNVLLVMNCNSLLKITCKNLVIIDTSAYRVMDLNYNIDKTMLPDQSHQSLADNYMKIEENFLNAFGMLANEFQSPPNKQLDKVEIKCMFEHQIQTTENLKETVIRGLGDVFIFTNSHWIKTIKVKRENGKEKKARFTQILLPSY